jgi:hypothetical protein
MSMGGAAQLCRRRAPDAYVHVRPERPHTMSSVRLLLVASLAGAVAADPGSTLPNGHVWCVSLCSPRADSPRGATHRCRAPAAATAAAAPAAATAPVAVIYTRACVARRGCLPGNVSAHHKFCDHTLPTGERVADLVSQLSLEEKIGLMCADKHTRVSSCNMMSAGNKRLGIPSYMHLVETNTAVASRCLRPGKCSVNYPGPTGLGATFNKSLWYQKGHNMGIEIRAFNNLRWYRMTGDAPNSLIGLNGYGPNLNIARDPRYGRTSELPGEDPFLTGTYAVNMVRGGQGMDEFESGRSKYLKMTLGLKHYALYTVEEPRPSFIPNVTAHDLWETYLPQYRLGE